MNQVFDAYARYYELLYQDKDYAAEAEYVASHIRDCAPRAKSILELGCGTGAHAEHLVRNGYHIHGVDISNVMIASAKNRIAGLSADVSERLSFSTGDMRTVRLGELYDVVISLFHVISYQVANSDLDAAFKTAATHLKPGGMFLFDFWYGPAVLTLKPEVRVKRLEDESTRVTRIAEPELHDSENIVDVSYHVWVEDKSTGNVGQISETHRMRYLFLPEVARLAETYGFTSWDAEEWMTRRKPGLDTWGVFVRAYR